MDTIEKKYSGIKVSSKIYALDIRLLSEVSVIVEAMTPQTL